jgi:CrcB protein
MARDSASAKDDAVTVLLVTVAGGAGAVCRWLLDLAGVARFGRSLPWGTVTANVMGSALAGAVAGATLGAHLGARWSAVLAVGFCGGLTTFSAASFDVARELERRKVGLGALLFFAPMVLALSAAIVAFHAAGG